MRDSPGLSQGQEGFVGKRSLERASMKARIASSWWDWRTRSNNVVLEEGAHRRKAGQTPRMELIGHVTSSSSSVLGHPIALALVAGGRARTGTRCMYPCRAAISKSK